MTIYVGFSKPKKFAIGAFLIQLWTRHPYAHTYFRLGDTIYHATGVSNVNKMDMLTFKKNNEIVAEYAIDTSEFIYRQLRKHCEDVLGEPYSFRELAQIALYDFCRTFYINVDDMRGYVCSGLVGEGCAQYLRLPFIKPTFLLTPPDIENVLKDRYENQIKR